MSFDPVMFGEAMGEAIRKAVEPLQARISELEQKLNDGKDGAGVTMDDVRHAVELAVKAVPVPKDGRDGIGVADLMIDRDGNLVATMQDGRIKSLGTVIGKDGKDGRDGADGLSLESFEMEYIEETHEVVFKASCAGRVKELRFDAGGLRPGGYWRDGTKAKAGEVYTYQGTAYVAKKATSSKPESRCDDWAVLAMKGRDGESVVRKIKDGPSEPIKLKGGDV